MISLPSGIKDSEGLKEFLEGKRPDLLDGDWKQYTPEMIRTSNSLQVPAWPDIQGKDEGPAVWQQAIEKGFRGLQTDHPAQLIQYLQSKGLR
jgi:glycerophosphoryl diester phosphodiesterase